MEIDNLKKAWQEKLSEQDKKIEINYKLFKRFTEQNVTSSVDEILTIQKVGTYLALVYAIISLWLAFLFFTEYYYSIPLVIAGILMIYSFCGHYKQLKSIGNIAFDKTSVKEYLKTVLLYEDWVLKSKKSDSLITFIWFTSIAPLYVKYVFDKDIYQDLWSLLIFIGVSISSALFMNLFVGKMYKDYNNKFNNIKNQLEEILEFEKE